MAIGIPQNAARDYTNKEHQERYILKNMNILRINYEIKNAVATWGSLKIWIYVNLYFYYYY